MLTANANPKILTLDLETKPTQAFVWQAFKAYVSPDQIIEDGGTICVGAKWLGDKEVLFFSEWEHGKRGMLQAIHDLLVEADAVVTFNGDRFDLPKLNGEFILNGIAPPPPLTSIDLIKTVKKMGLFMNRLAYVGPLLEVGDKIKTEGFSLWRSVMNGDAKAQKRMKKYCKQDVKLTEKLYLKLKPYIRNHPTLGVTSPTSCSSCGSVSVQSRGYRRTKAFRIQRLHCQSCGSWHDGVRSKVG